MPLYLQNRDINLINTINKELINKIIDTKINIYKINKINSEDNLYGEALRKVYFPKVQVAGLITHDNPSFDDIEQGTEATQEITISLLKDTLEEINLYPEIGDIIEYNEQNFEISGVINNQFLGGQTNFKHSLICQAHLSTKTKTKTEKIKQIASKENYSLYRD